MSRLTPERVAELKAQRLAREREARAVGYSIRKLSKMGRGINMVLAHLYIEPKTLTELRSAIADHLQHIEREASWAPDEHTPPDPFDTYTQGRAYADHCADDTVKYDVGQLLQAGMLSLGDDERLSIGSYDREAVGIYLKIAFYHGPFKPTSDVSRALWSALQDEGLGRRAT